jgi:sulfatase modifying factor 1
MSLVVRHRVLAVASLSVLASALLSFSRAETKAEDVDPEPPVKGVVNSIKMKLVWIRPGTLKMGSPRQEQGRQGDEDQHEVQITKGFYLGACEVTQAEYEKVTGKNPSQVSPSGEALRLLGRADRSRFPADCVTWEEAVDFCKKLSARPEEKKAGRVYRLPTEAEWEYACRAGTTTATHYGDSLSGGQANFHGGVPYGEGKKGEQLDRTCKVGSYKPNKWGLFDVHGNVWEWCADWYGEKYYQDSPKKDPSGPAGGTRRVFRGGSWAAIGRNCRSAHRTSGVPTLRATYVGFRVAMTRPSE